MKKFLVLVFLLSATLLSAQKVDDLFRSNDVKVSWLGVDFSHVKLIGCFSEFSGLGTKSARDIKYRYFPEWNKLILHEREKYDIAGMLRRDHIFYDVDMIFDLNENTPLGELESYNIPYYTSEDINSFVGQYNLEGKDGIGIVFIAEALNKSEEEAYFHFVALNLATKEILLHKRLHGDPGGFGMRNYWAGAMHDVMEQIARNYYRTWRNEYARR